METKTKGKRTAGEAIAVTERIDPKMGRVAGRSPSVASTTGRRIAQVARMSTSHGQCAEAEANARTMALSIGAANAVDALGLDGDAAIAALPGMCSVFDLLLHGVETLTEENPTARAFYAKAIVDAHGILARLRPATSTK